MGSKSAHREFGGSESRETRASSTSLPPGPELPLDEAHLAMLIEQAMVAAARGLREFRLKTTRRIIYRTTEYGWGSEWVDAPDYYDHELRDGLRVLPCASEWRALATYLWDMGGSKWSFPPQDGGSTPDRNDWESVIYQGTMFPAMRRLLNAQAWREIVETGVFTPWRLPEEETRIAAKDLAGRLCNKTRHVWAHCPVKQFHFWQDMSGFSPEDGVYLGRVTGERMKAFFWKYQQEFLAQDEILLDWEHAIEIDRVLASKKVQPADFVFPSRDDSDIAAEVTAILDRVRWAVTLTLGPGAVFEEGPVVLGGPSGWRGRTLRRGAVLTGTRGIPFLSFGAESAERIARHIAKLKEAQSVLPSDELGQVLWHFGRACNAVLPRDILLESVIGLEMLLVPDAGESTYKFSLHGAAVIGAVDGKSIAKELGVLYGFRSRLAHGGKDSDEVRDKAVRARWLLARAIWGVVSLINDGTLDVAATGGDIGRAVKDMVFRSVESATIRKQPLES